MLEESIVSKIVLLKNNILTRRHEIACVWLPANTGILGNNAAAFLNNLSTTYNLIQGDVTYKNPFTKLVTLILKSAITASICGTAKPCCASTSFQVLINKHSVKRTRSPLIFRLHTSLCSLHYHLHRIGLHPKGLCEECNLRETVEHFLIHCEQYTSARTKVQQTMQYLTIRFHWIQILQDVSGNPLSSTLPNKLAENLNNHQRNQI